MRGKPDPDRSPSGGQRTPFLREDDGEPGADRTRFVCGFLGCDARPFNPLLDALPRLVHAPVSEGSRQWVASLLDAAVRRAAPSTAGSEAMLAKLAELMFVEAIRIPDIELLPAAARGWLAGVRDPSRVQRSGSCTADRRAVDRQTSRAGSRDVEVGTSPQQFSAYVRISPMQYLARWRLQLAARMLETGTVSVAQRRRLWVISPKPRSTAPSTRSRNGARNLAAWARASRAIQPLTSELLCDPSVADAENVDAAYMPWSPGGIDPAWRHRTTARSPVMISSSVSKVRSSESKSCRNNC